MLTATPEEKRGNLKYCTPFVDPYPDWVFILCINVIRGQSRPQLSMKMLQKTSLALFLFEARANMGIDPYFMEQVFHCQLVESSGRRSGPI